MAYVFISGIPTSGKSFLARRISERLGAYHLDADTLREGMKKDPQLEPWVNFFWNQDEKRYLTETPCAQQWSNIVKQAEAFWPTILRHIKEIQRAHPMAIFEGDTILPHLASRDLGFPGVYLLGESLEHTFARNKEAPRWGKTEELQRLEAETFFNCEGPFFKKEAEKYGFKTFTNSKEAETEILRLLEME